VFCRERNEYATDINENCVLQNPLSTKQYCLLALQDIPFKQFANAALERIKPS
jgi:hypothetical protein